MRLLLIVTMLVDGAVALTISMSAAGRPQFPEGAFDPGSAAERGDSRTWAVARMQPAVRDAALTDWSNAAAAVAAAPSGELDDLLSTFDFDTSTDDEVIACEKAVFRSLRREAGELTASWLTASLAQSCVLKHESLPDAMAAMLSSKVHEPLPGAFAYSTVGGTRAEQATAEEALRSTMARVLSEADVRRAVVSDLVKVLVVDPAADGLLQPMLFFKGFHALSTYRVAHSLWQQGSAASKGAALMLQSRASELFGVDIHPAATIGNGVMLDHANGVVIGSTVIMGSDVYMLHGVTLGATGKPTYGAKRHPTIGSSVILGAGSTVLGDITVADGCTVGASAIVTKDVPAAMTVVGVNKLVERPAPPPEPKADEQTDEQPKGKKVEPKIQGPPDEDDEYTWMYGGGI